VVYGPDRDHEKQAFHLELKELRVLWLGPWLPTGDFNLIYCTKDKNNTRLDRRLMGQFIRFLNEASLREIHISGRLFTWSNKRAHPTLECIDRAFISKEWDEFYPSHDLTSLASMSSDHAPLLLCTSNSYKHHKRCHFKAFWLKFPGFLDVVKRAWHCPLMDADPCHHFDWLLRNIARVLES
jgi:hypothetical protein